MMLSTGPLFFPESCHTPDEGDASTPSCHHPYNFQTLVTVKPGCPASHDQIKLNGIVFPDKAMDLATSKGKNGGQIVGFLKERKKRKDEVN